MIVTEAEKAILENQRRIFHGLRLLLAGHDNMTGFSDMQDAMLQVDRQLANARVVEG